MNHLIPGVLTPPGPDPLLLTQWNKGQILRHLPKWQFAPLKAHKALRQSWELPTKCVSFPKVAHCDKKWTNQPKTLERERMKTITMCKRFYPWFTHQVNIIIIILIILKIAWMRFFKIFPQIKVGLFCVKIPLSTAKYQMLWKLPRPRKNSSLIFVFFDFPVTVNCPNSGKICT